MPGPGERTTTDRPAGEEPGTVVVTPAAVTTPATGRRWARPAGVDGVLLAAIVAATGLRLWGLGAQSLWYDEWLTGQAASGSLGHLRWYVTEQAGIPPTYFSFMWVWARVAGDGDAALRLPSVVAGVALVPVAYAALRELGRRVAAARIAAVLVAVNPMLIWYSQEARPYSVLALLGTLSLLLLARARRTGRRGDLMWWSFVAALAVAVHYVAVFLVAVEVAVLLWRRRPGRADLRDLAIGVLPAAAVLAALAPFGVQQFSERGNHSWITGFPLRDRLEDTGLAGLVGPSPPDSQLWIPVALVAAVALVLLAVRGERDERRAALLAGGFGLVPVLLALLAAAVGVDMFVSRYLIVVLPAAIGAVAVGLGLARAPRAVGVVATGAIVVVSLVVVAADVREPELQRAGWRDVAVAHTTPAGRGGERLLVVDIHGFLGLPLHRYLDGERRLGNGEAVTVEQIDVVVAKPTDRPCNLLVGLACALIFLGAPPPEPLAGELRLAGRIDLDQFVLERYLAEEPLTVTAADVVQAATLADSLILVTPG